MTNTNHPYFTSDPIYTTNNTGTWQVSNATTTIGIPVMSIEDRLLLDWVKKLKERMEKEEELRNNNPALKSCWDEYQTILKLVK